MKKKYLFLVLAFGGLLAFLAFQVKQRPDKPAGEGNLANHPIAVVELFTSEGCSSCPAADVLLSKLVEESENEGRRIFPLSFHVDYWNRLGWKDPFSNPAFSNRQRRYAKALKTNVYTPQMVFNGAYECVGSNHGKVEALIEKALQKDAPITISLAYTLEKDKKWVNVRFSVENIKDKTLLNLALVERKLNVEVRRGENRGKNLHHDNVVRQFGTLPLQKKAGEYRLALPSDINLKNASIVAYVQDPETLVVAGASQIELSSLDK